MHLTFCGRIFKHTILEIVYDGKGTPKQNTFPSFRKCVTTQRDSHHSFPKLHHIQFTEYIFRNPPHFFQKNQYQHDIPLPKCDTFDWTTKGRTWLVGVTSQDHPDYTQLIWSSSIKIHFIDSQLVIYLN